MPSETVTSPETVKKPKFPPPPPWLIEVRKLRYRLKSFIGISPDLQKSAFYVGGAVVLFLLSLRLASNESPVSVILASVISGGAMYAFVMLICNFDIRYKQSPRTHMVLIVRAKFAQAVDAEATGEEISKMPEEDAALAWASASAVRDQVKAATTAKLAIFKRLALALAVAEIPISFGLMAFLIINKSSVLAGLILPFVVVYFGLFQWEKRLNSRGQQALETLEQFQPLTMRWTTISDGAGGKKKEQRPYGNPDYKRPKHPVRKEQQPFGSAAEMPPEDLAHRGIGRTEGNDFGQFIDRIAVPYARTLIMKAETPLPPADDPRTRKILMDQATHIKEARSSPLSVDAIADLLAGKLAEVDPKPASPKPTSPPPFSPPPGTHGTARPMDADALANSGIGSRKD